MNSSGQVMHVIFLDPLWVAAGFLLFTLSASLLARKSRSLLAIVSAVAFGYCVLAQFARFGLQFVPDTRTFPLGNALFVFSQLWPVAFLVAGIAVLAASLHVARKCAP